MKKIITILISLLIAAICPMLSKAQAVVSSEFESFIGTYQEITGGTVVGSTLEGTELTNKAFINTTDYLSNSEIVTDPAFAIGFDFEFNNQTMNRFAIGCYPQIVLGRDNVKVNPYRSAFWLSDNFENCQNVIGTGIFANMNITEDTEISYKLEGATPNRVLVVQWKNIGLAKNWANEYVYVNMQIRLFETTNKIHFIYKGWEAPTSARSTFVGIRGMLNNDKHLRVPTSGDWTNTTKGTDMFQWGANTNIPDGLTFVFTPPADCVKPTTQANNLQLSASSIGVSGSFTATDDADHYLIVMTTEPTLSQNPVDGVLYNNNEELGNGTVITYTTETSFVTPETLTGATKYYFHLFATNSYCSNGPKYNTVTPLVANIKTCPEAPASLKVIEEGYTTAKLSVTANAAGNDVIVLVTDIPLYSQYGDLTEDGEFALPSGSLNVGDELEITDDKGTRFGGRVIYKGASSENIEVENMSEGKIWHFIAYSVEGEEYSSTSVRDNLLTWAKLPYYVDYSSFPPYQAPFGWEVGGNGDFRVEKVEISCKVNSASEVAPVNNTLTTQYILLSENVNRLVLNANFYVWGRFSSNPYNDWSENDYFDIEASTDGENFSLVYRFDKENAPQFETYTQYKDLYIPIESFKGQKVKFRINWKLHSSCYFNSKYMLFEEMLDCDYPINLAVDESSIFGTKASISWTPRGDETLWNVRYREVETDEWTIIENITNPNYTFTALPPQASVEVQVQANCSAISQSHWSTAIIFNTGVVLPYYQDFAGTDLPGGWQSMSGVLADPTELLSSNYWSVYNGLCSERIYGWYTNAWALFPKFDFGDGSFHYQLAFDLKVEKGNAEGDKLYVLISQDGETFNTNDVIATYDLFDDVLADGENHRQTISLKAYTDMKRLAFYSGNGQNASTVYINNLSITETCPPVVVNTLVEDITGVSAKVSWEGDADEWLVALRKLGETELNYEAQNDNFIELSDLDIATTYQVYITHSCGEDDMAKPTVVRFTTLAVEPCYEVEEVEVKSITVSSAIISWTHSGIAFNVQYRKIGDSNWKTSKVETAEISLANLLEDTEYEYSIQAVCSEAEGDISEWMEVATFKTLAVTCFPPTNIVATTTHKSAVISWEGKADKYEVNYRVGTEGEWLVKEVSAKTLTLDELVANTEYSLRIRSKCSNNDISAWSSLQTFKTLQIPECVTPTNLQAKEITNSSVVFVWDADESNLNWNLRYRKGSATSWITENGLADKTFFAENLERNTAYIWTVRANCEDERQSPWATQGSFSTTDVAIDGIAADAFSVFASGKLINIVNPDNMPIDRIKISALNGMLLQVYEANTTENIIIPTSLDKAGVYIVQVESRGFKKAYKVLIK